MTGGPVSGRLVGQYEVRDRLREAGPTETLRSPVVDLGSRTQFVGFQVGRADPRRLVVLRAEVVPTDAGEGGSAGESVGSVTFSEVDESAVCVFALRF